MGVAGACRLDDLVNLTVDNIQDHGTILIVKVPDSKSSHRTFTVSGGEQQSFCPLSVYRKYLSLRPSHTKTQRLFLYFKDGKCTIQVVGRNALGKIPSHIARYLDLPEPSRYTGYCFRRSSVKSLQKASFFWELQFFYCSCILKFFYK